MKKIGVYFLCSIVISLNSCNNKSYSDFKEYENNVRNDLEYLATKFDSIIKYNISDDIPEVAYKKFLLDYENYYTNSSIIYDIHDLFINMQISSGFLEIWELSWVLNVKTYECEIWILPNLKNGVYWKYLAHKSEDISSPIYEAYQYLLNEDNRVAFNSLIENISDLDLENEIDKHLFAIIIITRIINSK